MAFLRSLALPASFVMLFCVPATAQRRGKLDCPRPSRQRAYRPAPALSLELGAGFSKPLLYHNGAGSLGNNFKFISMAIPYLSVTGHLALNERLDVIAGLSITQTWQGLRAGFDYGSSAFAESGYTGSLTMRVPVGIAYRLSPGLRLDVAPYVSYSTHSGYKYDEAAAAAAASQPGLYYSYESPEDKARINFGLSVGLQVKLGKRLGAEAICAVDGGSATPSFGIAYVNTGSTGSYINKGTLSPYLLHMGLGLCYKLWSRGME